MYDETAWDTDLDEAQLAAVVHGDDPLVIVAGAGTGKTRVLTARVAHLLERGVPPERILLLTFTRRAADDMLGRAAALAGHRECGRRLRGGTFHAVAHQLISSYAETLGLQPGFSLLDPADAADVMDLLRDESGLTAGEVRIPRSATLVEVYSRCINTRHRLGEVLATDFPWCEPHAEAIASLFKAYVSRKRSRGQVDFDDLLLLWRAALADDRLGPRMIEMFDYVLVDEYQDVNALQVEIVRALRPDGRGLTVVGDDAQAIYGFRGADSRYLHDLATALPGATVIPLERNFRSLQPILNLANLARPAEVGVHLTLKGVRPGGCRPVLVRCHDAPSEARAVVDRILEAHDQGMSLRDQAVLVRAAYHSDLIELELTARRVPYRKYGGLRFVEAAHVKDLAAAVRLLDNPADELAWFRLLRMHEGIGPARGRSLLGLLAPTAGPRPVEWAEVVAAAPARSRGALTQTLDALDAARELVGTSARVAEVFEMLRPLVLARYSEGTARVEDLERLCSAASAMDDLSAWLAEITLDPPVASGDLAGPPHLDEDYVVISTVHSAKGLEWSAVHLPHLVDGAFPSDMALTNAAGLAEERRLFYVATTRARDRLTLYTPLRMPVHRRAHNDRHCLAPASRFLSQEVLSALDIQEVTPARSFAVGAAAAYPTITVDLDHLWR
jgi:DNA helicase-2/ATP-dependent DNA helicase PcrA